MVRFDAVGGAASLAAAAEIASRERATIDICGLIRRQGVLLCLALVGGAPVVLPADLETEELELAEKMRLAIADLPADLSIRSFLRVGNPRRKVAELVAAGDYDLIL